ncbi:MAG: response regulator [Lachnospiraceae bacterium]|nr:response regulator [Lachnospiraceae bacterium]
MRKGVFNSTNIYIKNLLFSVLVITFFVGIILAYNSILYREEKNNIIRNGEMTAMQSADEFEDYLITSIDAINLAGYSLEIMIREKSTHDEILDFVLSESETITNAVFENTTGLYAYIEGEYYDGAGWIPDEDFEPTKRPWYSRALQGKGQVVLVDPYLDLHTGTVMMTLAKCLSDGESVVAMDVTLDRLQEITEEAVRIGDSDMEMILDSRHVVVAHSSREEVGRSYRNERDTIGAAIDANLHTDQSGFFEFDHESTHYIAYSRTFSNDWHCISVQNATKVYNPLRVILVITILLVVIIVLVLSSILYSSSRRELQAEKLNAQLSSTADIYLSVHEIDIINDTFSEIRVNESSVSDYLKDNRENAQETFYGIMDALTDPSSKDEVFRFIDLSTLEERMKGQNSIIIEFLDVDHFWLRARFVVSRRTPEGRISHVIWLVESIDEERKNREKLIDISQRAIAASEAKSAFLSNISHEIRTPINAVLGMNEMILRECGDENILAYADSIRTAGNTLLGLINDVLDFSKIEAGKMEILPVDYGLSSVINDLVNMIQTRADEKGLALKLDFDPGIPNRLLGDEVRIKQAVTNILTNAVKYTDKGSVTFSIGYERLPEEPDSVMLCFAVEDTGIGIRKEDMQRLFSEFERIDEERNRYVEGTGLGMNITKSLLELMGSSLKVESTYGKGSRFHFKLKQKVLQWDPMGDYEASYRASLLERDRYQEKFTAPEARVLVIDDTSMNLMVFKSLLKKTRVKIETALSGDEGLSMACDKKYDMIFLDHMMPEKDGIETLHELQEMTENPNLHTPVICLTANAISGAREKYLEEGFTDYLTKPIDSARLEDMLLTYLPEDKIREPEADAKEALSEDREGIPDFVGRITELDLSLGLQNNNDPASYVEVMAAFSDMSGSYARDIEAFLEERDFENATIRIHALKSSARIIGAVELGDMAERMEEASRKRDAKALRQEIPELLRRTRKLGEELSSLKEEEDPKEDLPPVTAEKLKESYEMIRRYLEEGEYDLAERKIGELAGRAVPEAEKERFSALKQAIEDYNYDKIPEILS